MAMASAVQANRMATHFCSVAVNPLRFVPQLLVFQAPKLRYGYSLHKAGLCRAAVLSRDEKNQLLMGVDKSHVDDVARVLELARSAADRWEVVHSAFLTPPVLNDALMAVRKLSDVGALISGGYSQAERCRLSVGHVEAIEAGSIEGGEAGYPGAVAALSVSGNFMFETASHGDFLGSILGTGVTRDKVGDIIMQGERGAQILVVPELIEFFQSSLVQVRNVAVQTTAIPLSALQVKAPRVDTFKSVEASLRVDALTSAGFRMSRSKLADLISSGEVRVNWKEVTKTSMSLKTGDVVSVRGKGRIQVGEIVMTKKGRYAVELTRYL
ncbi:hypothetical protein KC19_12G027500 [Ceratodon purpureus]|uniref:RNA-binding S4 domain-containing protein n=2 Tax=Ceratodon purpureus TaxID=3225 RepID=A0A8T0G344_CERPU|nr:hypothetical protein KC19_12G027500 [Ceratodon purpureus]